MKKQFYSLCCAGLLISANASATMIDQFLPADGSVTGFFGVTGAAQQVDSGVGNILGDERDLGALVLGGSAADPLSVSAAVTGGEFLVTSTGSTAADARAIIDYDGPDGSGVIQSNNHFNLLSTGLEDSFVISVTDILSSWSISVIAYNQGGGANNLSTSVSVNSVGQIVIPFTSLSVLGTGADLTDLGELQFRFTTSSVGDATISLDYLCTGTANGCSVTASVPSPAPAALILLPVLLMVANRRRIKR